MVSIFNKATKIISKTGELMARNIFNLSQKSYFFTEGSSSSSFDHPTNFISGLGIKGKYALFFLIVLLSTHLKAQNINTPNKNGPLGTQVNTLTGNFFLPRTDIYVPARGIDFNISFYYNTFSYNQNIGYGNGWTASFGMNYKLDSVNNFLLTRDDGRQDFYTLSQGVYTAPNGIFDKLSQYQTGKFLLTTKYGMQYYFDNSSNKRLTKMQDPNGNYININYNDSLPTSVTNAAGQTITMSYSNGHLATLVDAMVTPTRTYTYSYDGYGNLIQVTDPLSNTTKYTYLVNGPMSEVTDKNANSADIIYYPNYTVSEVIGCNSRKSFSYDTISHKTTVTDYVPTSTDQTTTYTFKVVSNQIWLTNVVGNCCGYNMSFDFDNAGNTIKTTDANGNIYLFTYDGRGNVLTATDPLGHLSTYTYSSDYNQITGYTDPNGNNYTVNYDTHGNITRTNAPNNVIENATYSTNGDVVSLTDANGNTYNFTYDAYGNPKQLSGPVNYSLGLSFNTRGNLASLTDPNGNAYATQYDVLDRLTSIADPLNNKTTLVYDPNNNLTNITDPNGRHSILSYDASNRIVAAIDAAGKKSTYTYDAMNNLLQYTDPMGYTSTYTYDNRNRTATSTDALGNTYHFSYDANGNITTVLLPNGNTFNTTFDKLDRPISATDANGVQGTVAYDNNGNLISFTNGTGSTTSSTYDANNLLVKITDPLGNSKNFVYDKNFNVVSVTDRNSNTSTIVYDGLDRITGMTDNNGHSISFGYDPAGDLTAITDQNSHITNYTFDALNRTSVTTFPDGKKLTLTYDKASNVINRQMPDGTNIGYGYDSLYRLTKKTLPSNVYTFGYNANGQLTTAANNAGTATLNYDAVNRLTSEMFNGHTTTYAYNMAARTKQITYPDGSSITKTYDTRNRIVSISKGNTTIVSYQYNNADQTQQITYGNGVASSWQYDFANRLNKITTSNGNIQNIAFGYDAEMRKTAVTRANMPQESEHYSYDPDSRLTNFTQGPATNNYTYDAEGNRTAANINGTVINYTPNNLNQYTSVNNINFTYDNNGNLTYDGTFYKTYDVEGRLLSDSASPTNKLTYTYDALDRRFQKKTNAKSINYYYAGLAQVEQRDANVDTLVTETVFSSPIDPVLVGVNHQNYYYHSNDLMSVEAITDSLGNLVERYKYDAYGKPTIYDGANNTLSSSLINNRFAFTGQEYDAETMNYHFYMRNYSPTTGSFIQRDPIGYGDGTNMYQYVHDNPRNDIDIFGLQPCPPTAVTTPTTSEKVYSWYEWTQDKVSDIQSILDFTNKAVVNGPILHNPNLLKTFTALDKLGANSGAFSKLGTGLNILSAANDVNDLYNFKNEGNSNDIYNKWDLGTNAVLSGVGTSPTPGGAIANGYNLVNSVNKMVTGQSFAQNFEPIAKGYGETLETIKDLGVDYFTLMQMEYNNPGFINKYYHALIKRNKKIEYYRTHPGSTYYVPGGNGCPPNNNNNGNQNPNPPGPIWPGIPFKTTNTNSKDPNEIIGPTGVGTPQFVSAVAQMPYTINFENSVNASAPAKTVRISYPVDPKQDMNNISLGSFGFNSLAFNIPANTAAYYQRLDARDSLGLYVDITAGLDVNNHQIFWIFQSIDPVTLLTPTDPLKGFLLLTDTSNPNAGHGFVNFFIKPLSNDATGDTTHAVASIVFDGNDTIPTNVAKNTIDAGAPTSHMNALPMNSASTVVPLSWTASDDAKGSGVQSYSLYVAVNNGAFSLYATNISKKDTTFTGASGNSYSFFVLGTDSVGNTETLKPGAEATTYINAVVLPVTWLYFNAISQGKDGFLTWATATEINTKSFEVERSIDGRNFSAIGSVAAAGNSTVQSNYTYTDKNVVSLNIPVVYYRLKQIDKDGNATYSNIVAVQLPVVTVGPIVQAYPNPFTQTLNVLIANMTALDLSDNIAIYTLDGRIVYEKPIGQRILNSTITLTDLPQLTPGMYILKLGLNKQTYSFKLMKQ